MNKGILLLLISAILSSSVASAEVVRQCGSIPPEQQNVCGKVEAILLGTLGKDAGASEVLDIRNEKTGNLEKVPVLVDEFLFPGFGTREILDLIKTSYAGGKRLCLSRYQDKTTCSYKVHTVYVAN